MEALSISIYILSGVGSADTPPTPDTAHLTLDGGIMETVSIFIIHIPSITLTLIPITLALPIAGAVIHWLYRRFKRPRRLTVADYTMGQIA